MGIAVQLGNSGVPNVSPYLPLQQTLQVSLLLLLLLLANASPTTSLKNIFAIALKCESGVKLM